MKIVNFIYILIILFMLNFLLFMQIIFSINYFIILFIYPYTLQQQKINILPPQYNSIKLLKKTWLEQTMVCYKK